MDDLQNRQFRKLADTHIDVANKHCDLYEPPMVNSSMLFAAARFSAFVVAHKTGSLESYDEQTEKALDYYSDEFRRMLEENLSDYRRVFERETGDPEADGSSDTSG